MTIKKVKNKNPDLLIVGAGPVGCVIAEKELQKLKTGHL